MRSLFLKIFVIFWIAQSLIFVISTALIVHHHFESPDVLFDGLRSSPGERWRRAAAAYESGGCAAVSALGTEIEQQIGLKDAAGNDLCNPRGLPCRRQARSFPHASRAPSPGRNLSGGFRQHRQAGSNISSCSSGLT